MARHRSKAVATWLAVLTGAFGAHRFYLHGRRDVWAWLHPWPTLLGLAGLARLRNLGQDDHVAWLLLPILAAMLAIAMLSAIVIGLTPDERWAQRFDQPLRPSGWAAVLGVIAALLIGAAALLSGIAFGGEKFFEYQRELATARKSSG
ncbi:MAG: TM2 domain-containing protein [Burkholderiales bacterium]|nr:TM2 domain-containing protein [Burkholderiales bacterium]